MGVVTSGACGNKWTPLPAGDRVWMIPSLLWSEHDAVYCIVVRVCVCVCVCVCVEKKCTKERVKLGNEYITIRFSVLQRVVQVVLVCM
jgi:hypothetical protein